MELEGGGEEWEGCIGGGGRGAIPDPNLWLAASAKRLLMFLAWLLAQRT
jgi:hypothetical protein